MTSLLWESFSYKSDYLKLRSLSHHSQSLSFQRDNIVLRIFFDRFERKSLDWVFRTFHIFYVSTTESTHSKSSQSRDGKLTRSEAYICPRSKYFFKRMIWAWPRISMKILVPSASCPLDKRLWLLRRLRRNYASARIISVALFILTVHCVSSKHSE